MLKRMMAIMLAALLLPGVAGVAQVFAAGQGGGADAQQLEKVKTKVNRLGTGERARATVRLKDGTKVKGYISQAGENDFVVRDLKTDAPTNIFYRDVAKVESNKGHSTAKTAAIVAGAAAGGVLLVLGIMIASLD